MIWTCLWEGIETPSWAREAFIHACADVSKSWDEVFGRPPKRRSLVRRRDIALRVSLRIENLRDSVGPDLFDKVGKEYNRCRHR